MREPRLHGPGGPGHVMAQLAACRRSVGLSLQWAPCVFELRGSCGDLAAIGAALGVGAPLVRQATETPWGWWRLATPCRAVVLGDPTHRAELERLIDRLVVPCLDVTIAYLAVECAALALAGPRAGRLASSSIVSLADPVLAASSGEDYWLVVLERFRASAVHRALLKVGSSEGAVSVDMRAIDLYRAAHRVLSIQRSHTTLQSSFDHMPRTGVPLS